MAIKDKNPDAEIPTADPATPTADLAIERLLGDESVSSELTALEETLTQTRTAKKSGVKAVEASKKASEASILGAFGRQQDETIEQGDVATLGFLESRSGFATNTAIIDRITKDTSKRLVDLEQRKQELLLQNNANAAKQISDLEFQTLQFEADAKQKAFTNLLSLAGLGLQTKESARQDKALRLQETGQRFQERSAINSIALQFGVTPSENDTLESITARVAPLASERQMLDIAKTRAEIARANAETQKALQGAEDFAFDDITVEAMAETVNRLLQSNDPMQLKSAEAIIGSIAEKKGAAGITKFNNAAIASRERQFSPENAKKDAQFGFANNLVPSEVLSKYDDLLSRNLITPKQYEGAKKEIDKVYEPYTKKSSFQKGTEAINPIIQIYNAIRKQ